MLTWDDTLRTTHSRSVPSSGSKVQPNKKHPNDVTTQKCDQNKRELESEFKNSL